MSNYLKDLVKHKKRIKAYKGNNERYGIPYATITEIAVAKEKNRLCKNMLLRKEKRND